MDEPRKGRLPSDRASVRLNMVDEPDGLTVRQGAAGEGIDKVVRIIQSAMSDYPWRGQLNLRPTAEPAALGAPQRGLKLEWQRVRLSAAHGVWRWNGEPVAATLFLGGHDPDDARTMASFAQGGVAVAGFLAETGPRKCPPAARHGLPAARRRSLPNDCPVRPGAGHGAMRSSQHHASERPAGRCPAAGLSACQGGGDHGVHDEFPVA